MKTVYISFLLHGNMCYDRYTKQEIREKFPRIYAAGVDGLQRFPEVTAHIDLPGLTLLSLKHHAPRLLEKLRPLIARRQVLMVGCQYAASHAMCSDEESDVLAGRLTMEMMRNELQPDISAFFPQETAFHPQLPWIMGQIGAQRLIVCSVVWKRPKRITGIDGSKVNVFPINFDACRLETLEEFYDAHEDGDFVMTGGDFELLGHVEHFVEKIKELAAKGKIIKWTTVERYEKEVGMRDDIPAPTPFAYALEDRGASPSFSRWVADPEDILWHAKAVAGTIALRDAGFADCAAAFHRMGDVDAPLDRSWTRPPDNVWDHHFEEVREYPETEEKYLNPSGKPTLLSRAWHQLLIGLNSDASGWWPWSPRTRHRTIALQTARSLAEEVMARLAVRIAERLKKPDMSAAGYVLALNTLAARTAEISVTADGPVRLTGVDGKVLPTETLMEEGHWHVRARVQLPGYGYRMLRLEPADPDRVPEWLNGCRISQGRKTAGLADGVFSVSDGNGRVRIAVAPFKLSDPSGAAPGETVAPNWTGAFTRVRETKFGPDLEVFTELAWAVWLRLVVSLREDRTEITAELHVDLPRRIGSLGYDPEGLLLEFRGMPGQVCYDVPYATIQHPNPDPSFIAVQRFAAIDSGDKSSFGVIAVGGNQSFKVAGRDGVLSVNLGASTQGRPDTRPECEIHADGTADHKVASKGDPFFGTYRHILALLYADRTELALAARRLRAAVPVFRIEPGNGDWPAEQSLIRIEPETAFVTAFRAGKSGCELVVNDISGTATQASCNDRAFDLSAYGVKIVRLI